ncbi:hypothetical protein CC80DRAFT_147476 [Byssothecium circinans]|uniref:Uncharacterized protein n=1 Tax=Byssothecium circinans TaxID=147558 RepID=A0A6A5TN43_9PLEO|nr:hypothetical protein CC80DRAFT_147476 [Byssothecium circinans]
MPKAFFTGWELWQQMTFVLACGIVATILLGLCKLRYDTVRMRKYTKVDKGKKVQTPEMLEAQTVVPKGEDIPFGIRAIESGIEIDGVWISRSNTPAGSSASSISRVELPRSYNNSQLELPMAQGIQGSSRASSRAPSSFDLATNAERIRTDDSRDASPPSGDKCVNCGHHNAARNSVALHTLEGSQPHGSAPPSSRRQRTDNQITTSNRSGNSSAKSSPRTSDESEEYRAFPEGLPYPAAYIAERHASYPPVTVDPRTDLDLLQSHRMSHVAETGQLTPRVRRPGNSGEWASATDRRTPSEIATANGVDYFVPQQKTPSPPPPTGAPTNDAPVRSVSGPTQDSHASNQAKQAVPLLETYTPRPFYLPDVYQPRGPAHQFSYDEMPIEVPTQQNNARDTQVLRKVNSGFEILRPGTFPPPSPEEEEKETPVQQKRQSKRLQKKRTASNGSRTSQFMEQM